MRALALLVLLLPSIALAHDPYGPTLWSMLRPIVTSTCNGATDKLVFNSTTRQFECGTESGGGSANLLDQSAGETDLRYDATLEAYYYDTDGGGTRATDGTEPFVDTHVVEVPLDYSTIQNALDSNDIKKGSTANQGGLVRVGNGTRTESFEIGGTVTTDFQFSTGVEGLGLAGFENGSSVAVCATTLLGDDTASNTVAKVAGAIGWSIRNLCIDMDDAATNDPSIGIHVGYSSAASVITKHGLIENVNIQSGSSTSIGIKLGDDTAGSDTAYNWIRNYRADGIGTALVINAQQTVGNRVDGLECANPTGTIGCVSIGSSGGEIELHDIYMTPGAASQTGINVRNEAVGALTMRRLNFEWDQSTGTMVNFDATGNTGAHRAVTITESRFQPQVDASTPKCIDWNRVGHLNVIGNSFESGVLSRTCDVDFNNPSATLESTVFWAGNDVQWGGTQSDIVVNRTTAGGPLRVVVIEDGELIICNGAGTGITLASTGCYGLGPTGPDGADWDFANALTAADISALDAGDTTTGTFADARIDGSAESDEITGLTDGQISDTLTASTSTTAAVNDNDTSIATTAFVQQEIDDGDVLTDNCVLENDSTPIPDSCVGDGSDAGGGGSPGGQTTEVQFNNAGAFEGADNLAFASSTAGVTFGAGSATAGTKPTLTSGTLLTTAEDGAIEMDADAVYLTTDAGNRGYVSVRNCIRADSTRNLTSATTTQAIFNSPTNGRLTLETGTYLFSSLIYLTAMSGTSGNARFNLIGAGTATLGSIIAAANGRDAAAGAVAAADGGSYWAATGDQPTTNMILAATGTAMGVKIDGTFEVTGAGTIVPSIALTTAAAATVNPGTYFCAERIGSTTMTNVGQWD